MERMTARRKPIHCEAVRRVDGKPCPRDAEQVVGGKRLCGLHALKVRRNQEQAVADLDRYRAYQITTFGTLWNGRAEHELRARAAALRDEIAGGGTGLHLVRLQAEHEAVVRELARQGALEEAARVG